MASEAFFTFGKALCQALCYGVFRLQVTGAENVPLTGPLIVAANHISYLDPVALGSALPRPISYMAKSELFKIPVLGAIIDGVGTFPVDRGKGDISAIRQSVAYIKKGRAVGIFPEGGRNTTGTAEAKAGVALLAQLAQAPVVPAFIYGGQNVRRLGQLKVAFGAPLRFDPQRKAGRDELANMTAQIMEQIRALGESIGAH